MRFMLIRRADEETEAGALPDQPLVEAMTAYNQRLMEAGALVDGWGLQPTAHGALVSFRDGAPSVLDGPFTEAKELVAGFTLIEVPSREEAIAWARKWPIEDAHGNATIEVRQVYTAADFGEFAEGVARIERDLRAASAAHR